MVTTVDLLRHGECSGGDILRGRTDSPLSERGREQMRGALADLGGWHRVVTSPLSRCRDFAERHAERLDLPLSIKPDWREVDFGVWDGRPIDALYSEDADALNRYYREPGSVTPEGGEPLPNAAERVGRAWRALLREHRGRHLLVFTHGGVMRLLLAELQNAPLTATHFFNIPHGALTRVQVTHHCQGDFPRLLFHRSEALL